MRHFPAAQRGSMPLLVPRANFSDQGNLQRNPLRCTDCNVQIGTCGYGMVRTCQLKSMHVSAPLRVHLAQKYVCDIS